MNKARKKTYKTGMAKRLVRGSLFLSFTRFVSSRVVRFFETGLASPLFRSVKTVDHFVRKSVTGPLFKKVEFRKNFAIPAHNGVARFFANNSIMQRLVQMQSKVLNSTLRTAGLFLLTFGIYAAAIFMLKRFVSLSVGEADTDDLIISALAVIGGLLLTSFGDKSIITALGGGKITGNLLSNVLGLNDSSLYKASRQKRKTSIGMSFLLGSVLGVLTMFVSPLTILASIAAAVLVITVFNVPEFGLLLTLVAVLALPVEIIGGMSLVTLASYLLKFLRLKRNLRFGTADALVLLLFIVMLLTGLISDGGLSTGEIWMLTFTAMYFVVKNGICSEKLVVQASNALCTGAFLGMVLYILGEFTPMITHSQLSVFARVITYARPDASMLAVTVAAVMPFAFASFSANAARRRNILFLLLAAACAFISDSFMFYALLAISLFVFIAFAFKAPFGAAVSGGIILTPVLMLVSDFTHASAVTAFSQSVNDIALADSNQALSANLWGGVSEAAGIIILLLLAISVLLIFHRALSANLLAKSPRGVLVTGMVLASTVMVMAESFMFNLLSDLRVLLVVWFLLGMCGSVYKVYYSMNSIRED